MTTARIVLLAALLLSVVGIVGAGSVLAQSEETPDPKECPPAHHNCQPPSELEATPLKNGVWLEWELGHWRSWETNFSRHEIYFYKQGEESSTASTQAEKRNILYGFVPYSDLEAGATYVFHIRGIRRTGDVAQSAGLSVPIPAETERSSLPGTSGRKHTHPGGFSMSKDGDSVTFTWAMGVSPKYVEHFVLCRAVGQRGWQMHFMTHQNPRAVDEVKQATHTLGVANHFFESGTRYVCRVKPYLRNGRWGPMSNAAVLKF